jgi:small nuclear ribonucleoprotein (snRNP)-like protein
MKSEESEEESKQESKQESNESKKVLIDCDLESETFDAKSSLLNDEIQVLLPIPNAQTFNNIDEYYMKTFGKINTEKQLPSNSKQSLEPIERTLKIVESVSIHKRKELQTVLTKMRPTKGPNFLLYRALNNRIKVMIRRRKKVELFSNRFGYINGLLIAFDKHYNLALTDCDETYSTINQNKEKVDVINHIKQLFIRGDNVVLISLL